MSRKWVYNFDEISSAEESVQGDWEAVRALLGGKGANLGDMTRIGVPVPPGFTVTTEACNAFLEAGESPPEGLWSQTLSALKRVEEETGKIFGDRENPLLVSSRSGAKFSMPGMMDTVLNIGLNDVVVEGLVTLTRDERFAHDSYRRLIQMFGTVVMGLATEPFEEILEEARTDAGVENDSDLDADAFKEITRRFKEMYRQQAGEDFPQDPMEQLRLSIRAVFSSWNGKRAVDYRNAAKIAHDLGTAVNICTMVFGNLGEGCATGVAMTRSGASGEKRIEGDYLLNAQGEDVVAGNRMTKPIEELAQDLPDAAKELGAICERLEEHYREMQDVEFTIERGKLWMLQTRDAKRTAQAAVRIAVEMAREGLISQEQAVLRVSPEQVDFFLHPQFDPDSILGSERLAVGLDVSPGAAVGQVALDADTAERWVREEGRKAIMVRSETKPDDVHGMLAAEGILTSKGGRTSHAALVARQFGKPAVVGVKKLVIDYKERWIEFDGQRFPEGTWLSLDGTTGEVYAGELNTLVPDIRDPWLLQILAWADDARRLEVWANADYPSDAKRAREYGAQGIGLCRTEHMFFDSARLPHVQRMILNQDDPKVVREALDVLLPFQRKDFAGLFSAMDGLPVIIRLIDPPLHEFLPAHEAVEKDLAALRAEDADDGSIEEKTRILAAIENLHESNPMLGMRGVRLGIHLPELTRMQVRAIFEAACEVKEQGIDARPEIMIPLTSTAAELRVQRTTLEEEARVVMEETGVEVDYKFGTMIEIPRAALTADELAEYAEFFSFGTNDLTQTTFGISRDDAEKSFLIEYLEKGILPENPFASVDEIGVGKLVEMAVRLGRQEREGMDIGICGEHGGDPKSVHFFHHAQLTYVSCSPFRVPIARLAAGQASLLEQGFSAKG